MALPRRESAMSVARRRTRVSSFFALMTQNPAVYRYPGGCAEKYAHAFALAGTAPSRNGCPIKI